MNYSDFIYDFNLYLCERFGYRNCCSVMHNANGICVSVHVGEMDLYIRFWEYSCGVGSIPDWSIIIVRSNFKRNQQENLKDLARFFKEYAPRYGYKYLCTEDDDYKYYQTLGLKLIHRGFFRQYNYGLPLKGKHSVNHVFSSPTSIINFTSKKPSYDDTRRSGRDNELLQRAQNDL